MKTFGPNWFTVTMGTGILALALGQAAVAVPIAAKVGTTLWLINIALFAFFAVMLVGRILADRGLGPILHDSVQSMFLGAIPMGLATITNGFVSFGSVLFGATAVHIATYLWFCDAALAIASVFLVPMFMFTRHEHALEKLTAVWLLPIVPAEVAAASAGLLVPHVSQLLAQTLIICSVVLWALSVPLALAILGLLFLRLALYKLPARELGVSGWLTLGPLGTGALALVLIGNGATIATAGTPLASIGPVVDGIGLFGGLALWGYGSWWWCVGIVGTMIHLRSGLPFNMGWWAFTFPLGVYTAATYALANALHVEFFSALALFFTVLLSALWSIVAIRTIAETWPKPAPKRAQASVRSAS